MLVLTRAPSGWAQNLVPVPAPVVQLADADGNSVAQVGTEITVAITAGEGAIVGAATVSTDTLGAATFEDLALTGPVGEKTLTFSSPGLLSASSSVNLTAGPAASIVASGGIGQSAAAGAPVSTPSSVLVTDVDAGPNTLTATAVELTGSPVTFTAIGN